MTSGNDKSKFEIFISSRMKEFAAERRMLFELIPTLGTDVVDLQAWVYEINAPASDHTIRDNYQRTLIDSELYIGIFGAGYGEWTVDEFNTATRESIPRHVYILVMDDEDRDERQAAFIKQIQGVEFGIAPRYFTDINELRRAVADSILVWLRERLMHRAGSTTATFADRPAMMENLPGKLIGREAILTRINPLLENGESVLLRGFGGMGKTALAATVGKQWIEMGKGAVLWQKLGSETSDAIFQALARPFDAHQSIAAAHSEDEKRAIIRQLIVSKGVRLVVLDDAWNGKTLNNVMRAVPTTIPVLVTSRHRYGLRQIIEVGELTPEKAIETLGYYANTNYANSREAEALCKHLGYHAFALEVAGQTIRADNLSPAQLLERIERAPEKMKVPDEFAEEGRATVADLITASLTMLDNETQRVFMAMGAFFAKQVTPEMLGLYFSEIPPVTDEMIAKARVQIPELAESSDSEVRLGFQQVLAKNVRPDLAPVEAALQTLARRGLVEWEQATDRSVASVRVHDLAYAYARATHPDANLHRALDACLAYTWRYITPSLANFAALRPEQDNFLGAATWALSVGRLSETEQFAWNLYADSGFHDYVGFYNQAITLLELATQAAEKRGDRFNMGRHLGNLGIVYKDLGRYAEAIYYLEQALFVNREIHDRQGEANQLGNLGIAYDSLGQFDKAIDYHNQALALAREVGDRQGEGSIMGNIGTVYSNLGQYDKAIEYHTAALAIAHEIGDRRGEGNRLGNLGIAYGKLGQHEKSIEYYERVLQIAVEIGDKQMEGNVLGNIGIVYKNLGQHDKAIEYYERAIAIRREIGDRMGQANDLNNIGVLHEVEGNYDLALQFYQQGRRIYEEMGAHHLVATVDRNIGILQSQIAKKQNPPLQAGMSPEQALASAYLAGGENGLRQLLKEMGASPEQIENAVKLFQQYKKP